MKQYFLSSVAISAAALMGYLAGYYTTPAAPERNNTQSEAPSSNCEHELSALQEDIANAYDSPAEQVTIRLSLDLFPVSDCESELETCLTERDYLLFNISDPQNKSYFYNFNHDE
jgi:hypothetical protein